MDAVKNSLVSIAVFGRGGQGAVTAATLLVKAAHKTGLYPYVMAFPLFGPERRGAPVSAYARISKEQIHDRAKIYSPDFVIVMDGTIFKSLNPIEAINKDGSVIINSHENPAVLRKKYSVASSIKIGAVDLVKICLDINLVMGGTNPVLNTPVLGAFCKMFPEIPLGIMLDTIKENFKNTKTADLNIQGAELAFNKISIG